MAEETNEVPVKEVHAYQEESDWFLAVLVGIANNGAGIGITLLVGGFLVSGTMVGGAAYFENFASEFSSAFPKDSSEEIRKTFAQGADPYKKAAETGEGFSDVAYIHLKEARFYHTSGAPIPENRGIWWRARLSEVSGFHLGNFSPAVRR